MNVLIIGNNKINDHVSEYFTQKGMDVTIIPDVYKLRLVTGEFGCFKTDTHHSSDFIILTEQPTANPVEITGLLALPLYGDKNYDITASSAVLEPVVFLLDHVCESPMSATISALNDAVVFAQKKRKVFYLSKFVRTAGHGIESLYREAREAGVTFVKYEDLQISTDLEKEEFSISVSDGELDLVIKTKAVYADGGRDVGEHFSYAVKKLNLTADKHGHLTADTYFLSPALTSRRGVFHLTRDLVAERLDEGLDHIFVSVSNGLKGFLSADEPSHGIAVIDGKKCVFCYNCFRACTHAALEPDPAVNHMMCLSVSCAGCGTCVGLCPANAVTLEKSADFANSGIGKLLVLCCENSGGATVETSDNIDVLTVPCGGLIDVGTLSEPLYSYKKVMTIVCPDDACRHFDGNKRACAQVKRLQDMLNASGLSPDNLNIVQASQAMPNVLKEELKAFLE